jgi:hypothetical protein
LGFSLGECILEKTSPRLVGRPAAAKLRRVGEARVAGRFVAVLALALLSILDGPLAAQQATPVIYSSLAYIEEAGDLVGTELILLRACGTELASYQLAQGEYSPPILVAVTRHADTLTLVRLDSTLSPVKDTVGLYPMMPEEVIVQSKRAVVFYSSEPDTLPAKRRPYYPNSVKDLRAAMSRMCARLSHPSNEAR